MSGNTRIVAFRGIPKREEILLRSFLNLADSNFDCKVEADDSDNADVVVLDESELKDGMRDEREGVNYIVLGTDGPYSDLPYVSRPLHWSSFTQVFEKALRSTSPEEESPLPAQTGNAVQPPVTGSSAEDLTNADSEEVATDIDSVEATMQGSQPEPAEIPAEADDTPPVDISSLEVVGGEDGEPGLRPGVMSEKGANENGAGRGEDSGEPAAGDTDEQGEIQLKLSEVDEESEVAQRPGIAKLEDTVVIETDFIESWTISIEAELHSVSQSLNEIKRAPLARQSTAKKNPVPDPGIRLPSGIRFWEGDAEILLGGTPLFLIDETGQRLYSDSPIREWTKILRERNLLRRDLSDGWYVDPSVKSSPLPWFLWCSAQARSKGRLLTGIDPGQEYLLEKWPNFELIRNDNQSLKLCALLFSRPESVKSLVAKSDIKGRKVVAFINACYLLGLIKKTGIDEEVVWSNIKETHSLSLLQRLRRTLRL